MRKMSQECLYVLPGGCRVNAKRCEAAQNIALRTAARKASTPARRTKTACPQVKDCLSRKRVEACLRGAPSEGAGRPDCVAEYCRCASGRGFGPERSGGPAGLMLDLFRHPHPRGFRDRRAGLLQPHMHALSGSLAAGKTRHKKPRLGAAQQPDGHTVDVCPLRRTFGAGRSARRMLRPADWPG